MWFLYLLTWLASFVQVSFLIFSIVIGLYYMAELIEEHTVMAKKVIRWICGIALICNGGLILENISTTMILCGIAAQINHLLLLKSFPNIVLTSPTFLISIAFFFVNHALAFKHFHNSYQPFSEIMAYFTICLWLVPFLLCISLTANDYVLPVTSEEQYHLLDDNDDVVARVLSRRGHKYGLLTFFKYVSNNLLPAKSKKMF